MGLGGKKTLYCENEANKQAGTFGSYYAGDRRKFIGNLINIALFQSILNKNSNPKLLEDALLFLLLGEGYVP